MIIGVTGFLSSGKDTVADYLIEKGFCHYSHSDELRKILIEKKLPNNRDSQFKLGNELRKKNGPDYLSKIILKKIKRPAVITSIRVPAEVETYRQNKDFYMIFVDAPIEERYKRIVSRAREGDEKLTFEQFKAQENRELKSNDPSSQQLLKMAKMADKIVINDGTKEQLYKKVDKIIEEITNAK